MQTSVAIIGCGWLGKALALSLQAQGREVIGTRQSQAGIDELMQLGIQAERLALPIDVTDNPLCFDYETLIVMIPPQIRQGKTDYPDKIESVVRCAQRGKVKRLVLVNSTAIYDGLDGDIDEKCQLHSTNKKVALLLQAEKSILTSDLNAISLRVSGLVGPDRLPTNFFKSGRPLKDGNAPVNLVHQADVIGCLIALLEQPMLSGVYNINSQLRMSKKAFYVNAAKIAGNEPPLIVEADSSKQQGKYINSDKVRKSLNYQFKHDDLLVWLQNHFCCQ